MKAIKAIYNGIDKFNDFLGRIFSVLSLAILAVIMCEVILRRIFNRPQIWTQDLPDGSRSRQLDLLPERVYHR